MKAASKPILYHGIPIVGRMPLFRVDERQAIRDNLKTQTRRVIKLGGSKEMVSCNMDSKGRYRCANDFRGEEAVDVELVACPYGKVGDVRCMREPLMRAAAGRALYRDDYERRGLLNPAISLITGKPIPWRWERDYLAAMYMPTEAARTVCRTTDIRVERLQEISGEDCVNEGAITLTDLNMMLSRRDKTPFHEQNNRKARAIFQGLWNSINAKRGYGWNVPQVVWVDAFEKLEV